MVKTAKLKLDNMPLSNVKTRLMDILDETNKLIPFRKEEVKYMQKKKYRKYEEKIK